MLTILTGGTGNGGEAVSPDGETRLQSKCASHTRYSKEKDHRWWSFLYQLDSCVYESASKASSISFMNASLSTSSATVTFGFSLSVL